MVCKTLGHHQITNQLGKGGMGEVFQTKDQVLGREVAMLPEESGKELYYRAPSGNVMVVPVVADKTFQAATPKSLFQAPPDISEMMSVLPGLVHLGCHCGRQKVSYSNYSIGKLFLAVIINWTALLNK